jgi:hypothetical protein
VVSDPGDLPPIEPDPLGAHHAQSHYAEIVALLRAINVKASVSFNGAIYGVQVVLPDTRGVVWSNYDNWAVTIVEPDGNVRVHNSGMRSDAPPDAAAKTIAFFDYQPQECGC